MVPRPYQLDFFEDDDGDKPCLRWIKELTPAKRHAIGVAMEQVLQRQGVSVCEEEAWGKQLGAGVFEDHRILLLHGYDKGEDPKGRRQQVEIEIARKRLRKWRSRRRAKKKRS